MDLGCNLGSGALQRRAGGRHVRQILVVLCKQDVGTRRDVLPDEEMVTELALWPSTQFRAWHDDRNDGKQRNARAW